MVDVNKLKGIIVERGKTQSEVAEAIGINKSTFYRKIDNPNKFNLGEVYRMVSVLNLSDDEAKHIFLNY